MARKRINQFIKITRKIHPSPAPVEPEYSIELGDADITTANQVTWPVTVSATKGTATFTASSTTVGAIVTKDNSSVTVTVIGDLGDDVDVNVTVTCVEDPTKTATKTETITIE